MAKKKIEEVTALRQAAWDYVNSPVTQDEADWAKGYMHTINEGRKNTAPVEYIASIPDFGGRGYNRATQGAVDSGAINYQDVRDYFKSRKRGRSSSWLDGIGRRREGVDANGNYITWYERENGNAQTNAMNVRPEIGGAYAGSWQDYDKGIKNKDRIPDFSSGPLQTQESAHTAKVEEKGKTTYWDLRDPDNPKTTSKEQYEQIRLLDADVAPESFDALKRIKMTVGGSIENLGVGFERFKYEADPQAKGAAYRRVDELNGAAVPNKEWMKYHDEVGNVTDQAGWDKYLNKRRAEDRKKSKEIAAEQERVNTKLEAAKIGAGELGEFGLDMLGTGVQMVPGIAGSMAIGAVAPGAAFMGFATPMYAQVYGNEYNNAILDGASEDEAAQVAALNATVEVMSEALFAAGPTMARLTGVRRGIIPAMTKQEAKEYTMGLLKTTAGQDIKTGLSMILKSGSEEGIEEIVAGILQPAVNNLSYGDEKMDWKSTFKEALYNGLVGAAMGGMGGVVDVGRATKRGADIKRENQNNMVRDMVDYGLSMPEDSKVYQLARRVNENRVTDEEGAVSFGNAGRADIGYLERAMYEEQKAQQEKAEEAYRQDSKTLKNAGLEPKTITEEDAYFRSQALKADNVPSQETRDLYTETGNTYGEAYEKAVELAAKKLQGDPTGELRAERIAGSVARIASGEGYLDFNSFSTIDPISREVFEEVTGETLPESNAETAEFLRKYNYENAYATTKADNEREHTDMEKATAAYLSDYGSISVGRGSNAEKALRAILKDIPLSDRALAGQAFNSIYDVGLASEKASDFQPEMFQGGMYSALTEAQQRIAFEKGVEARQQQQQEAKEKAKNVRESKKAGKTKKTGYADISKLSKEERKDKAKIISLGKKIARRTRTVIVFETNETITKRYGPDFAANGWREKGEIHINLDAADPLLFTFSHEFTHQIAELAPEEYLKLQDFIIQSRFNGDRNAWTREIDNKMHEYAKHKESELGSRDAAIEEIIADMAGQFLNDEQTIMDLFAYDETLAEKIKDVITKIVNMFLDYIKEIDAAGIETGLKEEQLIKARELWLNGAKVAKSNGSVDMQGGAKVAKANAAEESQGGKARFSLPSDPAKMDADYLAAVNRGDMETAQRMVDEAAERAMPNSIVRKRTGDKKLIEMYHGSGANNFYEFRMNEGALGKGAYFTSVLTEAMDYSIFASDRIETNDDWDYVMDGETWDRGALEDELLDRGYVRGFYLDIRDEADLMRSSYASSGEIIAVIRDPSQAKSSDPVTYDDNGEIIPLSKRFDDSSDDIRFSMSSPVERSGDLVAIHNVNDSHMYGILGLGGIPSPSVAVAPVEHLHGQFGAISILLGREAVDPAIKGNKLYGGDAYTPTFPTAESKIDKIGLRNLRQKLHSLAATVHKDYADEISNGKYSEYLRKESTTFTPYRLADLLSTNTGVRAAYLAETNPAAAREHRKEAPHKGKLLDLIGHDKLGLDGVHRWVLRQIEPLLDTRIRREGGVTDEYTADAILNAMLEDQLERGEATDILRDPIETLTSYLIKDYSSIEEARRDIRQIQRVDEDDFRDMQDVIQADFEAIAEDMAMLEPGYDDEDFYDELDDYEDDAKRLILGCAIAGARTEEEIKRYIRQNGRYEIDDTIATQIAGVFDDILALPRLYFEAKPQRVIRLDDIRCVIVPDNISRTIVDKLEELGVPYEVYSRTDWDENGNEVNGRLDVINKAADKYDAKFSLAKKNDADYLAAVNRGDMETAQRMVDEAARKAGYDSPKLFHGTKNFGFTKIDTAVNGGDEFSFWATEDEVTAASYTKGGKTRPVSSGSETDNGIYALYANTDNMYELNGEGRNWNNLSVPDDKIVDRVWEVYTDEDSGSFICRYRDNGGEWVRVPQQHLEEILPWALYDKLMVRWFEEDYGRIETKWNIEDDLFWEPDTTRSIARWAKDNKYDGVIFRNITDYGIYGMSGTTNVYAFFNPTAQVKSADPVTYDDQGNVIPLSQRFNEENNDIRYSLNAIGMTEKNGVASWTPERINSIIQMDGGDNGYAMSWAVRMDPRDFLKLTLTDDSLDRWSEATRNVPEEVQGMPYSDAVNRVWDIAKTTGEWIHDNQNYPLDEDELRQQIQTPYLEIRSDRGFRVRSHEGRHRMRALAEAGITSVPVLIVDPDTKYDKVPIRSLILTSQDFGDGPVNGNASVVVDGLIPVNEEYRSDLEEKFGARDGDQIKFSMSSPVEETRDLIAIHNRHEETMLRDLRLGGIPFPSVAITRAGFGHRGFGPISLLFNKDTIDPRMSRWNEIYGHDAWTPTFPSTDKKINREVARGIRQKLKDILGAETSNDLPGNLTMPPLDDSNLENKLQSWTPYEQYGGYAAMELAYLKDAKGIDIDIPLVEGELYGENRDFWEQLDAKMPEDYDPNAGHDVAMEEYEPIIRGVLRNHYDKYLSDFYKKHPKAKRLYSDKMEWSKVDQFLHYLYQYRESGMPQIVSDSALNALLDEQVDEDGFKAWVDNLFDGIIEKEGIRNDKDYLTPSGNRRSWESLHYDVTLDNVVKAMRQGLKAGNFILGNNPKGAAAKRYGSISDVRADRGRLTDSQDVIREQMGDALDKLTAVTGSIADHNQRNTSFPLTSLDVGSYLAEILNQVKSKAGIKRRFQSDYDIDVTDSEMNDLMEAIDAIANAPTDYFEAKPRRAVGFDEVVAAIIPSDSSQRLRDALDAAGIRYMEYEAGNEEDRLAVINQAADDTGIKFQLKSDAERERQELIARVNRLKRDKRLTRGREPKANQVAKFIRQIKKDYSSDYSLNKGIDAVTEIYKMVKSGDDFAEIYGAVQDLARSIADASFVMRDVDINHEAVDLRSYFKTGNSGKPLVIRVDEQDLAEFDKVGGIKEFRKKIRGVARITTTEGMDADVVMGEIVDMFGEQWDYYEQSKGSYMDALIDALSLATSEEATREPQEKVYRSDDRDPEERLYVDPDEWDDLGVMSEIREDEVNMIIGEIFDAVELTIDPDLTFADRKKAEKERAIRRLKEDKQKALQILRETKNAQIEELKKEKSAAVRDTRALERERANRMLKLQRERQKQKERNSRTRKRKTQSIHSIERIANRLSRKLLQPSDALHIPERYRKAIATALASLDFESTRTDKWIEKFGHPSKRIAYFRDLKDEYKKIMDKDDGTLEMDDDIYTMIEELSERADGLRLADMTPEQVETVRVLMHAIEWQVNHANKMMVEGFKETRAATARQLADEINAQKGELLSDTEIKRFIKSDSTPVHFFDRLGLDTFKKMYVELTKAQDEHIRHMDEAIKRIEGITNRAGAKNIKKWSTIPKKHTLADGTTIEMTDAQVMSLYALSKREQARGHILGSGIVIKPLKVKRTTKGKVTERKASKLTRSKVKLTYGDVLNLVSTLSNAQMAAADDMLAYMRTAAEWGNETSMRLYGYRKFTEKNYFPIQSAQEFVQGSSIDENKKSPKMWNAGFTKAVQVGANNPLVLDDFFDVATAHINQMSQYNTFVPILQDMDRVYNYIQRGEDNDTAWSVQQLIQEKHGTEAAKYIEQLMEDISGNLRRETNDLAVLDTLLRNWKAAKIGLSFRVLMQQPTAVVRALYEIDPKYFAGKPISKKARQRMWDIAPIALWKHWGYSQTDIHRSMRDTMMGNKGLKDQLFFDMYGKADDIGWTAIFMAVERETRDLHPELKYDSPEYRAHVNQRFREIVDRTQVVDSVLHRSQLMRSQNTLIKAFTAFMAEPTVTVNTVVSGMTKALEAKRAGNKKEAAKYMTRTGTVFFMNAVAVSLAASLASTIRETFRGDDDDDDEEQNWIDGVLERAGFEEGSFMRDWLSGYFVDEFKDNINFFNMFPLTKDVVSKLKGFDSPNPTVSLVYDTIDTGKQLYEWMQDPDDKKYSGAYYIERSIEKAAELFGIPASNIRKEVDGITNMYFRAISEKEYGDYLEDRFWLNDEYSKNKNVFIDHYVNAKIQGHEQSADDILDKLHGAGVTEEEIEKRAWKVAAPDFKESVIAGRNTDTEEANLIALGLTQEEIDEKKAGYLKDAVREAAKDKDATKMKGYQNRLMNEYGYGQYDVDKLVKSAALGEAFDLIDEGNYTAADGYITYIVNNADYTHDDIEKSILNHYAGDYYDAIDSRNLSEQRRLRNTLNRYGVTNEELYEKEANHYKDYYRQKAYMAWARGDRATAYQIAQQYASKYPGTYKKGAAGMIYGLDNLSEETVKKYRSSSKYTNWQIP